MNTADPEQLFQGRILILVPHMDDAVLGCGGTLARLAATHDVRLLYCTDGRGGMSEEEIQDIRDTESDIGSVRKKETYAALALLGVAPEQLSFLPFPEWGLSKYSTELRGEIASLIDRFAPNAILIPSRFDKHVDHLALNTAARAVLADDDNSIPLFEYFVYYEWKLLPSGDIRRCIKPEHLVQVDIDGVSSTKRNALDAFVSQTTLYEPSQHKPVLSDELLTRFAAGPEIFMRAEPELQDRDILTVPAPLVHLLNHLEPFLKNTKEKLLSIIRS